VTLGRVRVGRDVLVLDEDEDRIYLEGSCRLRPGHPVVIVSPAADDQPVLIRTAVVWSWRLVRVGSGRPLYEGICQWPEG
jgi:hypothetical protein